MTSSAASIVCFETFGPAYLWAQRAELDALSAPVGTARRVALFGVPYDSTVSYRAGARLGPDGLRAASQNLETYSPRLDLDLEDLELLDLGNLEIPRGAAGPVVERVDAAVDAIFSRGAIPMMFGGEHSITSGAVRATLRRYPELVVVQLDAHADLRDGYLGEPYNHASAMQRCLDGLPGERLVQVGIRSGTREEWQWMRAHGGPVDAHAEALARALEPHKGSPIYLTIDLDVFDPSVMPGTGTPEPGGIDWRTFEPMLDVLRGHHLVAADAVELAPELDSSGVSSVLAAKVVREVVLLLAG